MKQADNCNKNVKKKKSKNEGQSIMTCKLPYGTHLSKFDDNIVNSYLLYAQQRVNLFTIVYR